MSVLAALLLTGSAPVAAPAPTATATALATARARILVPAEVRRIGDRVEVHAGDHKAPTQVHRTVRRDGGETADFY